MPSSGLASQVTQPVLGFDNIEEVDGSSTVSHDQTPVTFTRASEGVSQNPVTGDLTLAIDDIPAFGGPGIQVGPSKINVLSNSDMRNSISSYVITDSAGIVTSAFTEASGLSESDEAFRLTINNTSGGTQTVEVHQTSSGGLINDRWTAQGRFQILALSGTPVISIRFVDQSNAQISSSVISSTVDDKYILYAVTHQLTAGSADFRWNLQIQVDDLETLDLRFTNLSLAQSPWPAHYVVSATGPTTRATDVVDIGESFLAQPVDTMWSVDAITLGPLTTLSGENQLQYVFSSYNGVDGTSLFVDDVTTITWRADFNSSFEDVTITTFLGQNRYRVYFRVKDDGGGGFDRQMFIEHLPSGVITASSVFNTTNLPIQGTTTKWGRDKSDANPFDGFIGNLKFWGDRTDETMNRVNITWPVP